MSSSFALIYYGTLDSKWNMKCSSGFSGRCVISSLYPEANDFVNFSYSSLFINIITYKQKEKNIDPSFQEMILLIII